MQCQCHCKDGAVPTWMLRNAWGGLDSTGEVCRCCAPTIIHQIRALVLSALSLLQRPHHPQDTQQLENLARIMCLVVRPVKAGFFGDESL